MGYDDEYYDRRDDYAREDLAREQRNDELDRDLERRAEEFKEDQEYERRKREQEMESAIDLVNRGEVEAAAITLGFDLPRAPAARPEAGGSGAGAAPLRIDAASEVTRLQEELRHVLAQIEGDPTLSAADKRLLSTSKEAMYLDWIANYLQVVLRQLEVEAEQIEGASLPYDPLGLLPGVKAQMRGANDEKRIAAELEMAAVTRRRDKLRRRMAGGHEE